MAKRRYICEPGWVSKRDADIEAAIGRKHGVKMTVKKDGPGKYKVCRTSIRRKRRR